MLIAARESFAAARKRLPYDAEVEWVGCRNLAGGAGRLFYDIYIDDNDWAVECDCVINAVYVAWTGPYTCYSSEQSESTRIVVDNKDLNRCYVGYRRAANAQNHVVFNWKTRAISRLSLQRLEIIPASGTARNATLFAPSGLVVGGQRVSISGTGCDINYYALRVLHGGDVVLDLVPVRTVGVGAFYDRISGQLSGLGRFASIGPDIAGGREWLGYSCSRLFARYARLWKEAA